MLKNALVNNQIAHRAVRYDLGGGHKLFWSVDYYWPDVTNFLSRYL